MEPCPNCGEPVREGAKFCTSCGYRIAVDDGDVAASAGSPASDTAGADPSDSEQAVEPVAGWPESDVGQRWADIAWAKPTPESNATNEPPAGEQAAEEAPSVWSASGSITWPAPPVEGTSLASSLSGNSAAESSSQHSAEVSARTPLIDEQAEGERAHRRATALLDELRETIAAIAGADAADLSGVVAELEVAVTPPGAVGPEELSELRDALLAARERPRDLDTVIDLTGRIEAMLALTFAYDRAIAAIERSLEVLRRS